NAAFVSHGDMDRIKRFFRKELPERDYQLLKRLSSRFSFIPQLIGADLKEENVVIVQELINGSPPSIGEINSSIELFADIFRRVHKDRYIVSFLRSNGAILNFQEHIDHELRVVNKIISKEFFNFFRYELKVDLGEISDTLNNYRPESYSEDLVLTHEDPNINNFLLDTKGDLYLIDWDNAQLGDPLRDIGIFLWRYVEEDKWDSFMKYAGIEFNSRKNIKDLSWWVIRCCVEIIHWFYERGLIDEAMEYSMYLKTAIRKGGFNEVSIWDELYKKPYNNVTEIFHLT
ncbi:phosphotransferase, partial [Candidatus Dojkabacteria bacterium]|nr:phosphotransferase [Candidatus Dojkabacteria bacterium]